MWKAPSVYSTPSRIFASLDGLVAITCHNSARAGFTSIRTALGPGVMFRNQDPPPRKFSAMTFTPSSIDSAIGSRCLII